MRVPHKAKPAVKQMQEFMKKHHDLSLSEKQVFQKMVEYNMFDIFGNPTQYAIGNGLVENK